MDEEVGADERRHSKVRDTKRSPRNKGGGSLKQLQPSLEQLQPYDI